MNMPAPIFPSHYWRSWDYWLRLCCVTGLILVYAPLGAQPVQKRQFDLPADAAEISLKQFAAQSELEVLFSPKTTADVRTNAIKGNYSPRDAMDRLLGGTGLIATQDGKTGAFNISRDSQAQIPSNPKKK